MFHDLAEAVQGFRQHIPRDGDVHKNRLAGGLQRFDGAGLYEVAHQGQEDGRAGIDQTADLGFGQGGG